jgi:archaellum component FlaC
MDRFAEKEYTYVPKRLVKLLQDSEDHEKIILEFIDESKREVRQNLESLDEDLLQYRAMMAKSKQAFREAKDEQCNAMYELWESYEPELGKVRKMASNLAKELAPIKNAVLDLQKTIDGVSTYSLEKMVEIVKQVGSMSDDEKDMFKMLLDRK